VAQAPQYAWCHLKQQYAAIWEQQAVGTCSVPRNPNYLTKCASEARILKLFDKRERKFDFATKVNLFKIYFLIGEQMCLRWRQLCLRGRHLCLRGRHLCLRGRHFGLRQRHFCLLEKHKVLKERKVRQFAFTSPNLCLAKSFVPRNLIPRFQHFPTACLRVRVCTVFGIFV